MPTVISDFNENLDELELLASPIISKIIPINYYIGAFKGFPYTFPFYFSRYFIGKSTSFQYIFSPYISKALEMFYGTLFKMLAKKFSSVSRIFKIISIQRFLSYLLGAKKYITDFSENLGELKIIDWISRKIIVVYSTILKRIVTDFADNLKELKIIDYIGKSISKLYNLLTIPKISKALGLVYSNALVFTEAIWGIARWGMSKWGLTIPKRRIDLPYGIILLLRIKKIVMGYYGIINILSKLFSSIHKLRIKIFKIVSILEKLREFKLKKIVSKYLLKIQVSKFIKINYLIKVLTLRFLSPLYSLSMKPYKIISQLYKSYRLEYSRFNTQYLLKNIIIKIETLQAHLASLINKIIEITWNIRNRIFKRTRVSIYDLTSYIAKYSKILYTLQVYVFVNKVLSILYSIPLVKVVKETFSLNNIRNIKLKELILNILNIFSFTNKILSILYAIPKALISKVINFFNNLYISKYKELSFSNILKAFSYRRINLLNNLCSFKIKIMALKYNIYLKIFKVIAILSSIFNLIELSLSIGRFGLEFKNVGDKIVIPNSDVLNITNNKITIQILAKLIGYLPGIGSGILIDKQTEKKANYDWLYDENKMIMRIHASNSIYQLNLPHKLDRENNYAMVLDGSALTGYINGNFDARRDIPTIIGNTVNLEIGKLCKARVYSVLIYNRPLSYKEIQYNRYYPLNPIKDGLVLFLKLNEGSGNIVHDSSEYQNNGTIYGCYWIREGYWIGHMVRAKAIKMVYSIQLWIQELWITLSLNIDQFILKLKRTKYILKSLTKRQEEER